MYSTPVTITPPRIPRVPIEYEEDEPVITLSPSRVIKEIRPRVMYQDLEPEPTTLTDLPRDVLIELLVSLPPGRLSALCGTSSALSRLCNDEQFLSELIGRKYKVTVDKIPGQTIKEKYVFISQFDPRYFTDPDFVKINPLYKRDFGLDYTSRKSPNDALNTIISIMVDSEFATDFDVFSSIYVTRANGFQYMKPGILNLRLARLLTGAMMTKSQSFVKLILSILTDHIYRMAIFSWNSYYNSFTYPYILSMEYGMNDIANILGQHRRHKRDFVDDAVDEIAFMDSVDILDRFIPYLGIDENLFRRLVGRGKYELADYVLSKLRSMGTPYIFRRGDLRGAINSGDIDETRYFMKYITPTEDDIRRAVEINHMDIARILQGQEVDEEAINEQ